jgi:hypothetical protein
VSVEVVAVTAGILDYISRSNFSGGELLVRESRYDTNLLVVTAIEGIPGSMIHPKATHPVPALTDLGSGELDGQWLTNVPTGTNAMHYELRHRPGAGYSFEDFNDAVPNVRNPRGGSVLLITHEQGMPQDWLDAGVTEYAAWHVTRDGVAAMDLELQPDEFGVSQLDPQWPVSDLLDKRVAVVGAGSIGGAAVEALAAYGIGNLHLIDPDRVWWHNDVRHVLGIDSVGFLKVEAMERHLNRRWPATKVTPHPVNVVTSAHEMRPLFATLDVVLCAADGIAARRVVSHLARRAAVPAVMACVLGDGAVGEVLRLRPGPKYGCLMCHRAVLAERGGIDVEVLQERDYGSGDPHRPMTAVGPDLWMIGQLAAKATVATILESQHGDLAHRLPGDHAVVGLRPATDTAPPFDVTYAGQIQWADLPEPRPSCATCSTP